MPLVCRHHTRPPESFCPASASFPISHFVARVNNHLFPLGQAGNDFGLQSAAASHGDGSYSSFAITSHKYRLRISLAKERAARNFCDITCLVDDDSGLDAKVVSQCWTLFGRSVDINDHVHTLFFNSQRRDLGKT